MPTIADNIVATLKASGVRRIYGLPGDSLNGFTDALRRNGSVTWAPTTATTPTSGKKTKAIRGFAE